MEYLASNAMAGSKCSYHEGQDRLIRSENRKSIELRNYQTNRSFQASCPVSTLYQDCRHQVCTATLMKLPEYSSEMESSGTSKYMELQSYSLEYLRNEAHDFLRLYQRAKGISNECLTNRLDEIESEILCNGLYTHTTSELEYGCQLAWRNSARCINRLYWQSLKILDRRNATTNHDMFLAICEHLRMAYNQGALQATVLVLGRESRMWSTQYLRFACYEQPDGTFLGDPMNRELTMMAIKLGWHKPHHERTQWDLLPIIVQCDRDTPPSWFELPEDLRPIVFLSHPDPHYDAAIKKLGLRWVAQPFVSDKAIEIGGIVYKCVPFSGWFMETEIGRNICDIQRYNMIPKLADLLGMDITAAAFSQLNIDRLYVEVNAAVLYSFQCAKVSIVDHHTAAAGFMKFMQQEVKDRGNTPADWIWLVPPLSGGMSALFHQEMLNYTVKPRVIDQQDPWIYYDIDHRGQNTLDMSCKKNGSYLVTLLLATCKIIRLLTRVRRNRLCIDVLYASNTGTAHSYAEQMKRRLIAEGYHAVLSELDTYFFGSKMKTSSIVIIITSTFGEGNAPDGAHRLEEWLRQQIDPIDNISDQEPNTVVSCHSLLRSSFKWCTYAVCALGSSAYANYCGFGQLIDCTFQLLEAKQLLPVAKCDAMNHQYKTFKEWENNMIRALKSVFPPTQVNDLNRSEKLLSADASILHVTTDDQDLCSRFDYIPLEFDTNLHEICVDEEIGPYHKDHPYKARVLQNRELIGRSNALYPCSKELMDMKEYSSIAHASMDQAHCLSENPSIHQQNEHHSVRLIVFDTSHLSYQPGDHVCVIPENSIQDVNAILQACDWKPEDPLLDRPCSLATLTKHRFKTLRELLTSFVDLNATLHSTVLKNIAMYATDPSEQRHLFELGKGTSAYEEWVLHKPTVKETFEQFPSIKIPLEHLIQLLPPIQPRYYSISSSNSYYPNELHITVSIVNYETSTGIRRLGFCSNYLLHTIPALSEDDADTSSRIERNPSFVRLFISANPYFRLPGQGVTSVSSGNNRIIDAEKLAPVHCPLLMFAVGSGIAPFRSFWQELQHLQQECRGKTVPRVLFLGVRTPEDLLYAKEIQHLIEETQDSAQVLTTFIPVYSRVRPTVKRYIQHALLEHRDMVYSMLAEENACIYMCGSIQSCLGIELALASVLESCDPRISSPSEAMNYIKELEKMGRIKKDMFG